MGEEYRRITRAERLRKRHWRTRWTGGNLTHRGLTASIHFFPDLLPAICPWPHSRDHPDRLSRLGQDDPAQARAHRIARPEDRRHRERVRRGEHRQRHPRVADTEEQIIQMSNGCVCCTIREDLRDDAVRPGREERKGELTSSASSSRPPAWPTRPGGADLLHGRRGRRELPARLDPDAGRRQARRRPAARHAPGGAARSASPTRSSSARPTWSTPKARSTRCRTASST